MDNRERQPPAGARFAAEDRTLPPGAQPTTQPSQPATAPRAGGKGNFPPVAVTQVELEETQFPGDGYDHDDDMTYEPEEYEKEEHGPEDPGVFSENDY